MIPSSVLLRLATLGLSAEQAEAVAGMLSTVEAATRDDVETSAAASRSEAEMALERNRASARARFHKWKETHSTNVSKREQTLANDSRGGVTRGEDKTSTQKIEPQESKGKSAQKRATRLPSGWSLPQPWRDEAIELGVPESLIDFEAAKMRDWSLSSKNGAKLDWHATWRNWCRDHAAKLPRGSPAQKPLTLIGASSLLAQRSREYVEDRSRTDEPAVLYFPASPAGAGR